MVGGSVNRMPGVHFTHRLIQIGYLASSPSWSIHLLLRESDFRSRTMQFTIT